MSEMKMEQTRELKVRRKPAGDGGGYAGRVGFGGAGAASGWPDERAEECCVSLSFNQRG